MRVGIYLYEAGITTIVHFIVMLLDPVMASAVFPRQTSLDETQVAHVRHVLRVCICIETERGRAFISCWMLAQGTKDATKMVAS